MQENLVEEIKSSHNKDQHKSKLKLDILAIIYYSNQIPAPNSRFKNQQQKEIIMMNK